MTLLEMTGTPIGSYAPDFELPDVDSTVHHLARSLENCQAIGVIFLCNHCPYVQQYTGRLKQLHDDLSSKGVSFIGINSNDARQNPEDAFDRMQSFAKKYQLNFPYLWDPTQDVARSFGALKTPHAFLLNSDGILCYSGGIDDNADPSQVKERYLQNAIAQLLAGQTIDPDSTDPIGCSLKWRR